MTAPRPSSSTLLLSILPPEAIRRAWKGTAAFWRNAILWISTVVLLLLLGACGSSLPPLENMPDGARRSDRLEYLQAHPALPAEQYQAIYYGRLTPGLTAEQVKLLKGEPDRVETVGGYFDTQWSWTSANDTTWVFFKGNVASAVDGTTPVYRFPEIQKKRITFRFVLPRTQTVTVSIYDDQKKFRGELLHATMEPGVHELVLKLLEPKDDDLPLKPVKVLRAGRHEVRWNARDGEGETLPNGLYYLRLESVDRNEMCRFSLMQS